MTARLIKFMGSHPDLVTGHMYSARHFAGVAGISPNSMATRLRRVLEVHDSHLRPTEKETKFDGRKKGTSTAIQSSFSTRAEKLSGEWLRRRIT